MYYLSLFLNYLDNEKKLKKNSLNVYKNCIKNFIDFLTSKESSVDKCNKELIELFLKTKINKEIGKRTLQQYVICLKHFYDFLRKNNVVKQNIALNIYVPNSPNKKTKIKYLNKEQISELFSLNKLRTDLLKERDQSIIELFYCTGIEQEQLINLTFDECDIDKRFLKFKDESGKERIVPFNESCRDSLKNYVRNTRIRFVKNDKFSQYLFLNADGNKISTRGLNDILKSIKKKNKFHYPLSSKILKNSFAKNLLNNGAGLNLTKNLLGRKTQDSIANFNNVSLKEMKNEYSKLFKK